MRHHSNNKKRGFTLVEILVAISIFSIVVAIATGGFISSLRTERQVSSLLSSQSNASLVLEQMAREIRTGSLFCHDDGASDINYDCNLPSGSAPGNGVTACTPIDSGYAYSPAPDALAGNSDLPMWDCPSLSFFNAEGEHVTYSLDPATKALMKTTEPSPAQSITGNSVVVENLHFIIFGNIAGDSWTPRVTIVLGVAPSSTDQSVKSDVLNLETTVSARTIDCHLGQC